MNEDSLKLDTFERPLSANSGRSPDPNNHAATMAHRSIKLNATSAYEKWANHVS
jgi:hypothetical protein